MQPDDATNQEKEALIRELAAPFASSHQRELQRLQRHVVGRLLGAGFCAFGCLHAVVSAIWPGFILTTPWYILATFLALSGAALVATAWVQLKLLDKKLRAGERAALVLLFQHWAKEDRILSANEIVALLRSLPDPLDIWALRAALRTNEEPR